MSQITKVNLSLSRNEVIALRHILYAGLGHIESAGNSVVSNELLHGAFNSLMEELDSEPIEVIDPDEIN